MNKKAVEEMILGMAAIVEERRVLEEENKVLRTENADLKRVLSECKEETADSEDECECGCCEECGCDDTERVREAIELIAGVLFGIR